MVTGSSAGGNILASHTCTIVPNEQHKKIKIKKVKIQALVLNFDLLYHR
jgi:hypothetical protein